MNSDSHYWNYGATYYGRVRRTLGPDLPSTGLGKILDWGCSSGYTTEEIRDAYQDSFVYGLDINPHRISDAQKRVDDIEFTIGDGFRLEGIFDFGFDIIFAMNNFGLATDSMRDHDLETYLANFWNALQQEGSLVISSNNGYIVLGKEDGPVLRGVKPDDFPDFEYRRIAYSFGLKAPDVIQALNNSEKRWMDFTSASK